MKLAIMQPYFFPYIGYFQLIRAVDKFVIYDDVTFIKQGWINRNNILLHGKPFLFTVPLKGASSAVSIGNTEISPKMEWKSKLLKTLIQAYRKAPYFQHVFPMIETVVISGEGSIGSLALKSLKSVASYLDISTEFVETSHHYQNQILTGQERVLDICKQEGAIQYINPIGGIKLYSKEAFQEHKIMLNFIKPIATPYKQFQDDFVPGLSIIDTLMFNSPKEIVSMLNQFDLI